MLDYSVRRPLRTREEGEEERERGRGEGARERGEGERKRVSGLIGFQRSVHFTQQVTLGSQRKTNGKEAGGRGGGVSQFSDVHVLPNA